MTGGTDDAWRVLCGLADVPDGRSAGFAVADDEETIGLIAVRKGRALWLYVNRCPHVRLPLDFVPGQFLDRTGTRILCSNHGALFRIEDGGCVGGPCRGHRLMAVPSWIDPDGNVWIPRRIAV